MEEISVTVRNNVKIIKFCNTKRNNALSGTTYGEIAKIFNEDAQDKTTIAIILTGLGKYFSSGNNLVIPNDVDMATFTKRGYDCFVAMVTAIVNYPKLLISVVNGPAIGIGFTLTALSDIAYASESAYFAAPFVKLGLCIEGCGSYLLPRILGKSRAFEVLLLGHKLSAQEALQYSLVSKIFQPNEVDQVIDSLIKEIGALPMEPVMFNKKLITDNLKGQLVECAEREAKQLWHCQNSEFFMEKVIEFITRKQAKAKL